jgi:tRNA A37 N6-isopentenylltransferase MiaA
MPILPALLRRCLMTSSHPPLQNVIAVCGPTATGKSKLAIELSLALKERFNGGQVINADALQVYAALPVLTAKVTQDEMQGVPHHLMSFLDPLKNEEYHMVDFKRDAQRVVRWSLVRFHWADFQGRSQTLQHKNKCP